MISSINSSNSLITSIQQSNQPISGEQKETIANILSNYDSSNMTESDFESMKVELKDAGIEPSEDLKGILEEAGFELPEGSGPKGTSGKTQPPKFSKLMERIKDSDISEEEVQSFIESLEIEKGNSGVLLDGYV